MSNETVFVRFKGNPIVTSRNLSDSHTIFNSAAVKYNGRYAGIFRVDNQVVYSQLHAGWSDDGINWSIDTKRIEIADPETGVITQGLGYDPRVTKIDNVFYITFCYYPCGPGPCIGLAQTTDFKSFTWVAPVMLPYNRNTALFPRKINGKYAALHRPTDNGHTPFGDIYYADSPDLVNWGGHRMVFGPSEGWQRTKVGAGAVPLETAEGWLMIYHGVRQTCSGFVYSAGGAILDLEKPWKVLYRSKKYLLAPTEIYESVGDVPNVIFPNAIIHYPETGEISLYYGCADTSVGLARANLDDVIEFIKSNS
jgi:beta-1,4-mannooligosaccharide/beta-1,4-mannosyl-N-acetylglucosamine phosphorylase